MKPARYVLGDMHAGDLKAGRVYDVTIPREPGNRAARRAQAARVRQGKQRAPVTVQFGGDLMHERRARPIAAGCKTGAASADGAE